MEISFVNVLVNKNVHMYKKKKEQNQKILKSKKLK